MLLLQSSNGSSEESRALRPQRSQDMRKGQFLLPSVTLNYTARVLLLKVSCWAVSHSAGEWKSQLGRHFKLIRYLVFRVSRSVRKPVGQSNG